MKLPLTRNIINCNTERSLDPWRRRKPKRVGSIKDSNEQMKSILLCTIYMYTMIIDSQGSEIKLLTGYLKGTVCIACKSHYTFFFFNLEGISSQSFSTAEAKVTAP